jgi:mono/diheme cytochrome c family protein
MAMRAGIVALALVGAWLAGAASAGEAADGVLADMGRPYFERYCASCHGLSGAGDGPTADVLRAPPSDLRLIAARRGGSFPDGEIAQYIDGRFDVKAHGSREMPVWGERFSQDIPEPEVADAIARGKIVVLIEYLKSVQISGEAP